jgi:hypothetical protein
MSDETPSRGDFFVHPQGLCESAAIGDNTRVWAFAHVLNGARIGRDCNICDPTSAITCSSRTMSSSAIASP